jgi:hypothetical protein
MGQKVGISSQEFPLITVAICSLELLPSGPAANEARAPNKTYRYNGPFLSCVSEVKVGQQREMNNRMAGKRAVNTSEAYAIIRRRIFIY